MGQCLDEELLVLEDIADSVLDVCELLREVVVFAVGFIEVDVEGGLVDHSESVEKGLAVTQTLVLEVENTNQGFHDVCVDLARNVLIPILIIVPLKYLNIRVPKKLLVLRL